MRTKVDRKGTVRIDFVVVEQMRLRLPVMLRRVIRQFTSRCGNDELIYFTRCS